MKYAIKVEYGYYAGRRKPPVLSIDNAEQYELLSLARLDAHRLRDTAKLDEDLTVVPVRTPALAKQA